MLSFQQIIGKWGRRADLAADLGVPVTHLNTMFTRNSIPSQYWTRAVVGAAERGIAGITMHTLTTAAALRAGNFTLTRTEDGTVIAVDPATGQSATGITADEALAELRRLLAARQAA